MKEIVGDIWDYHDAGHWIVITTNGTITRDYDDYDKNGVLTPQCVMGAGIALQTKQRFPDLPFVLGRLLLDHGNTVHKLPQYRIYTFPVKTDWWMKADMRLIVRSCNQLAKLAPENELTFMVRPGCGVGRLAWRNVKPEIGHLLDDRFVVVELPKHSPFT